MKLGQSCSANIHIYLFIYFKSSFTYNTFFFFFSFFKWLSVKTKTSQTVLLSFYTYIVFILFYFDYPLLYIYIYCYSLHLGDNKAIWCEWLSCSFRGSTDPLLAACSPRPCRELSTCANLPSNTAVTPGRWAVYGSSTSHTLLFFLFFFFVCDCGPFHASGFFFLNVLLLLFLK